MKRTAIVALASAIVLPATASAQSTGTPQAQAPAAPVDGARLVDDLAACRAITDSGQRLACYDRTATALVSARERRDIVVVDQQQVRRTRRTLFGFALPRIRLFGGGDNDRGGVDQGDSEQLSEIETSVTEVTRVTHDRYRLGLADGTEWELTEGFSPPPPKAGDTIMIRAGALGSYRARIAGRPLVRIRRLR